MRLKPLRAPHSKPRVPSLRELAHLRLRPYQAKSWQAATAAAANFYLATDYANRIVSFLKTYQCEKYEVPLPDIAPER